MKKIIYIFVFTFSTMLITSCRFYSFTGGDTGKAKTLQIDFFRNNAPLIEPSLSQKFTQDFRDLFLRQTNLELVSSNGDLRFEGEITGYRIAPMSATAQQTAAQNRLTITINVRYFNVFNDTDNFEKPFMFYYDYPANSQLTGGTLETAFTEIIERITQDIFNASIAKW
ncbi:MAG: LptE family protein [Polaribacter sp.]|nr:LptE family protein [Polaribacter sp.]MDG1811329.1 LptE family protein [Polaribacter sp.]MDG1994521.1 LptE family protein [Polaribacter sp.]